MKHYPKNYNFFKRKENKTLPLLLMLILLCVILFSCEEDDIIIDRKLFVKFKVDNQQYYIEQFKNNYEDYYGLSKGTLYRGGLKQNTENQVSYNYTPKNVFSIAIHGMDYFDIKEGFYDFIYYNKNESNNDIGVNLRWMNTSEWINLLEVYRTSEEYKKCINSFDENAIRICEESSLGQHDFYQTRAIRQAGSYFKINKTYYKLFDKHCPNQEGKMVYDLIIEGDFRATLKSSLDTLTTKSIEGEYRIHIPSPLKFECNDSYFPY